MTPYKIIQVFINLFIYLFILLPSLLILLQVDVFLLTVITVCIRPCDTINSTQSSQECTTILQLKFHKAYKVRKPVGHPA